MDLSTVMTRINAHHYNSCSHYLKDIDLITNNCLEYNPDRDQYDKLLRNRACELRDVAYQLVNDDLDPEFEKVRIKTRFLWFFLEGCLPFENLLFLVCCCFIYITTFDLLNLKSQMQF